MRTTWTFHSAGQLHLRPRRHPPPRRDRRRPAASTRLLLVTDPVLLKAGVVDPVLGPLQRGRRRPSKLFAGGEPEPSLRRLPRPSARGRDFRPDAVLGLGGGSNMDLAKIDRRRS